MADDAAPSEPTPARRARFHPFILGAVVLVAIVVSWGVVVGLRLVRADRDLREGIAASRVARSELAADDIGNDTAVSALEHAEADFRAAHAEVGGALFAPLRALPIVGTQVRSVSAMSAAATTVSRAGAATLATVHRLLTEPHHTPAQRAAVIGQLASALGTLQGSVDHVGLGPDHGLLSSLAAKRNTFAADLIKLQTGLAKAHGAAAAIATLFRGPSTYLVIAANNAEMRAGSGMALELGTLHVSNGSLRLQKFVPASSLVVANSNVRATGDLAARWGFEHPTLDFRDLLLSPQFAPNAELAARMWKARTGQSVDGVLLVDIDALGSLLQVTGPVSADGVTLSGSNAVQYLLEQQYVGLPYLAGQLDVARHQKLGALAAAALRKIEEPGLSLTDLARTLDAAADSRHLLAWASSPATEAEWNDAGVAGAVDGDDVLLGVVNQGANKLDPYQDVHAAMQVTVDGRLSHVRVTVAVHNTTPRTVVGYAAGGGPGLPPPRVYSGAVNLDFPSYAGDAVVAGNPRLEAAGADYGADVLSVPIRVAEGATRTVTFSFTIAGAHGALDVLPSARVPLVQWSWRVPGGSGSFADVGAHGVSW